MKVTRPGKEQVSLQFGKREGQLFLRMLQMFPISQSQKTTLSRGGGLPDQPANEQLLEESLKEARTEHRQRLDALLADPARFSRAHSGLRFKLTVADLEWLLQILNDVRVGCWVRLGCPEHTRQRLAIGAGLLNLANAQDFWAMEVCGFFQMQLLEALHPE